MYKLSEVIDTSGDTEEEIFELGISKKIKFLVMVPELGACEVPTIALSHFMAGADDYQAELMPEHWSKTPSGPWNIKRDRLRIYADSWDRHWNEREKTVDDLEARTQPPAGTVKAGAVEVQGWVELARAKAQAIIKRHCEKDLYPSQNNIADEIAKEFRNATPQIVGAGGKPLTGAYIKRHALRGISSEQGRQLSTSPRLGK